MHATARPVLARLLVIDRALRSDTYPNAATLAGELEVNPRTVRRDIEYLRDRLHAPIEYDPIRHGFYYSEPSFRLPFLQLTEGELVALFLAEGLLQHYHGSPYGPELERAFAKITAGLGDTMMCDSQRLAEAVSFRTPSPPVFDPAIIRTLIQAIHRRRRIVIEYWTASTDAITRREVDPYHLASLVGQYYLIAYCHYRNEVRQFVPARIRSIETTDVVFTVPDSFRVEDYLSGALAVFRSDDARHHVRLRFTGLAARFVRERQWHASQSIETGPGGDTILSLDVSHLREVEQLVLSWLPDCEALEPPELRQRVAEVIRQAATAYAEPQAGRREPVPRPESV